MNRYTLLVADHGRASTNAGAGINRLKVDRLNRRATFDGKALDLSRMEFKLLAALASDPFGVKTTDELLRDVWGYALPGKTRTVAVTACRLRRKLADAGAPGWIVAIRGVGYRLTD